MSSKSIVSILCVTGIAVLAGCTKADMSSDKAKYSYAIGVQISKNLKEQGVDLDVNAFAEGAADVFGGKELKLKDDERMAALQKMSQAMRSKEQETAKENLAKGQAFLEENKKKEGFKTTASGLQYKIVKEGTGPTPKATDEVEVNYRGTLIDGKQFDSSYDRHQTAKFPVGHVIPGWTEALQLMKVGSKAELVIPPNLAYGDRGNPSIPPNSVLLFEVELVSIVKNDTPTAPAGKAPGKTKKSMKQ